MHHWIFRGAHNPQQRAEIEAQIQSMLVPDLYAWRRLLPDKRTVEDGGMTREEYLAQYAGLPGVNVG